VASPQPAESASTNTRGIADGGVPDAVARHVEDLQRTPLATRTRDAYASHVGGVWSLADRTARGGRGNGRAAATLVELLTDTGAAIDVSGIALVVRAQ
jgi:hypothetical protein